ncbi:odorant receptor 33b-like [Hermetia illucens]|uniref:odorant receptor 33b-like n=1 Tax=Hermetia illucens TaxID=343691 RepID=UPI0018CBFF38|nr:odorant receptor 33b-like [Hermetia illucens]
MYLPDFSTYRMGNLGTYRGLKQIHLVWRILCLAPWTKFHKCYYICMSIILGFNMFLMSTIILDVVFCGNFRCAFNNVTYYLALVCKVIQYLVMLLVQKKLFQVDRLFHILDEHVVLPEDQVVANKAIEKGQRILKYFLSACLLSVYCKIVGLLFTSGQVPILPLWSPFEDYFVIKLLYDSTIGHLIILQTIANDMYAPICFLLLNAHLKILSQQLLRAGCGEQEYPTQSNISTLVKCHVTILKIYKILDETIPKMFFVVLLIASILLCISITSIITNSLEPSDIIFTVGLTSILMFQILPICVLAHQFQSLSEEVADAAYASNWPDQDRAFRRAILLIIQRAQNCKPIVVCGIVPINLPTFLSIVRCAYSFSAIYSMMN